MTDTGPANGPGHNVAHRKQIMSDALDQMYQLDAKVAAALTKHVAPIRAMKRDIKKNLNKELNINSAVFEACYAPYKLAAKAHENEDESTLDNLKEFFASSPIGHQMDAFKDGDDQSAVG